MTGEGKTAEFEVKDKEVVAVSNEATEDAKMSGHNRGTIRLIKLSMRMYVPIVKEGDETNVGMPKKEVKKQRGNVENVKPQLHS